MRENNDPKPQGQAMQPNEIRAELLRRNITVTSIADDLGIAMQSVTQVIVGDNKTWGKKTPHIREYIASKIGKEVAEVWPDKEGE